MYLFQREGPYLAEVDPAIALTSGAGGSRLRRWLDLREFLKRTRPQLVVSFLSYFSVLTAARAARHRRARRLQPADADVGVPSRRRLSLAAAVASAGVLGGHPRRVPIRGRHHHDVERRRRRSRRRISASPRRHIRVVHNPVDLQAIAKAAAEPLDPITSALWSHPAIVAAGRLADAKNYPLLHRRLRRGSAHRAGAPVHPRRRRARRRVAAADRALGLDDAVVLCGFQRNPWKYIARADVFALSSRYEGFGNVLVEAMACGVPVVATASPGTREIVSVGTDGLLVDRHEPHALAAALAARPVGSRRCGSGCREGARSSAQRFALPTIAAAYDRVLGAMVE